MTDPLIERDRIELAEAFRTFISQGEDLLKATTAEAGEVASAGRLKMEAQVANARAKLAELEGSLSERSRAAARATDRYVHENPWQSMGVAAGVGVILGLLIGRR